MILRDILDTLYEERLRRQCRHIPNHIAIIMDGNRRFAKMLGRDTSFGHKAGVDKLEEVLDWAQELGVKHITLYSFSTENFSRNKDEVDYLLTMFRDKFVAVLTDKRVARFKIRVQMLGDLSLLPDDLREAVRNAEEATKDNTGFTLNIALAYGGRNEIVLAARDILRTIRDTGADPDTIDVHMVEEHLHQGKGIPPVDLIIRTGNECRTSNFLPWLASGHESAVYFCAPYWPLFRKIDLLRAIRIYDQRMNGKST